MQTDKKAKHILDGNKWYGKIKQRKETKGSEEMPL